MPYVQRMRRPLWHRNDRSDDVVEEDVAPATGSYAQSVLSQIIWFVAGVISVLLAFEIYTLLAMVVYLAAAWILSSLVNIGRRY
jgi:hypothetical protein